MHNHMAVVPVHLNENAAMITPTGAFGACQIQSQTVDT